MISPRIKRSLRDLGARLKLARLRRRFTGASVAERASISHSTYLRIEKGDTSVSMESYANVLLVFGLLSDFEKLADDDDLGRLLQDKDLPKRIG